ncbi:asparagine synthase (glutamine-hydrolyzing) [Candidatus Pacearchaeota archaeon]|nr:asparagine synthase (glutamine-hydrolyzing) [Candidatus Pacearchaeota archaeon]
MCGILGIYSRNIDKEQVRKATETLHHRGPDGTGYFFDNNIAFGHRRLAVIDLSENAKQPMCNESGDLWITYNGEVYNFKEIKQELENKGHQFKSNSDTEVILHAYEEWKEKCLEKFNGMFALAIWNSRNRELFLARDRAGVKPLYYYFDRDKFIFASEIKAILEFSIEKKLNKKILYDYFNYGILVGEETLFENIKTLPAAHYFILKNSKITAKKWWDFEYSPEQKTESAWISELRNQIALSVEKRMISDVPVGAFISGGIDSACIVACMKKFSENVKTFYVCSGDADERKNVELTAKYFNTEHNEIFISANEFAENLQDMIWHNDMPLPWPSAIPLYFVSKLSKGKATVVLTGEGSDELFAGYRRYSLLKRTTEINSKIKFLPQFARNSSFNLTSFLFKDVRYRKNFEILLKKFNFDYATGTNAITSEREKLLKNLPKENPLQQKVISIFNEKTTDFLNKLLYLDFRTYLQELLMKQDKMGMAASIEARTPFLDYNIIELAAKIPSNLKLKGNTGKYIFKKAMETILPKQIVWQKKKGFPVPIDKWFRHELHGFIQEELSRDSGALHYLNKDYIKKILEMHKRHNCSLQIWALLNFKLWHEQFIEQ